MRHWRYTYCLLILIMFCRHGEAGMTVHFNVHMDPAKGETMPEDLADVILGEILYAQNNTDAVLSDVVIDEESLDIQGKDPMLRCSDPCNLHR